MTGPKKILLFMLVICTLGYGSAWAYDGQIIETDDQISTTIGAISISMIDQLPGDQHSEQNVTDAACAQCNHIFSHLQAIFTHSDFICSVNQSSELQEFSEDSFSFVISPDLRPPRV